MKSSSKTIDKDDVVFEGEASLSFIKNDSSSLTKNDISWQLFFESTNVMEEIDDNDFMIVKAKDLKTICKQEPRLLAKMDCLDDRPIIFKDYNLSILPVLNRGTYAIGKFNAYQLLDFKYSYSNPIKPDYSSEINNPLNITRGPDAILYAYNHGMFSNIGGTNDSDIKMVSYGRRGTEEFNFNINSTSNKQINLAINSTQMELDGVFESQDFVISVEAKINPPDDFIIRQLYYPYRALSQLTDKEIVNVFLTAPAGAICLHQFKVDDKMNYNSLNHVESVKYVFHEPITFKEVRDVVDKSQIIDEPKDVPFPQANSVDVIFSVIDFVSQSGRVSGKMIGDKIGYQSRQGDYYGNAAVYLGFLNKNKIGHTNHFHLSEQGKAFVKCEWRLRKLKMIEAITKHHAFSFFIREYIESGEEPDIETIENWIRNNCLDSDDESNTTVHRRASTVRSWVRWVLDVPEED